MSERIFLLTFALMLTGCLALFAVHQPGEGVRPSLAQQWGCDYEEVMREAERARQELGPGENWIPEVGWTVCELLSWVGAPQEVDLQQTPYGRSASWWYRTDRDVHLVTVELREDGRWVVDYVGW